MRRLLAPLLVVDLQAAPGKDYRQIADKAAVDGPVRDGVEVLEAWPASWVAGPRSAAYLDGGLDSVPS